MVFNACSSIDQQAQSDSVRIRFIPVNHFIFYLIVNQQYLDYL